MSGSIEMSPVEDSIKDVLSWVKSAGHEKLEDLKLTFTAAKSLESLEPANVPEHLQEMIGKIKNLGPQHRSKVATEIDAKMQELSGSMRGEVVPEETKPSAITELTIQNIAMNADAKTRASMARMDKISDTAVYQARVENFKQYVEHKDLQKLLPFFLRNPPTEDMSVKQQYAVWDFLLEKGELCKVVRTSLDAILKSTFLSKVDKAPFIGKSVQDIVSDPALLFSLLKTDYDRNLVIFSTQVSFLEVARPDLHNSSTLSDCFGVVRDFFQQHAQSIRTMNATSCDLTCIPQEICLLPKLQLLNLTLNDIRTLPSSIGKLQSLVMLSLMGNPLQALPASIGDLRALRELDLRQSELQSLPASIEFLLALRKLFLDDALSEKLRDTTLLKGLKERGVELRQVDTPRHTP